MKRKSLLVIGVLFVVALMAACAPGEDAISQTTPLIQPDTEVIAGESQQVESNVQQVSSQDTIVAQTTNNCLNCHSDIELLEELAEEEVVVEAPSEGSG